ncbi:unnamed protein product [Boreogadus saida]
MAYTITHQPATESTCRTPISGMRDTWLDSQGDALKGAGGLTLGTREQGRRSGLPHMVENAGMKNPLQPPGKIPHPSGLQNPDGTDPARDTAAAAAARDTAAAARDSAAAARDAPAAAARDTATAARDAAARDTGAAARDAAAAGAAAGYEAAARDGDGTLPSAYADVGTGRPCMLATCWAQGTSGSPTIPARVMEKYTQALKGHRQRGHPPPP